MIQAPQCWGQGDCDGQKEKGQGTTPQLIPLALLALE